MRRAPDCAWIPRSVLVAAKVRAKQRAPRPRFHTRHAAAVWLRSVAFYDVPAILLRNIVAADAVHRACLRLDCMSYVHALAQGCAIDALSEAIEDLESE